MKPDASLVTEIEELIANHAFTNGGISLSSRLGQDLRLVGDDAEEFLKDFSKRFDVDLSRMTFHDYFPDESTADMHFYLSSVASEKSKNKVVRMLYGAEARFWRLFAKRTQFKTVTVEDLIQIVRRGQWV